MRQFFLLIAVFALLASLANSAAPPPIALLQWSVDDVIGQETAAEFSFSPDGRFIVWAKTTVNKDKNAYITHLFRRDCTTGREVQLTRGSESCASPRWSPDGRYLAFLSSRPVHSEKDDKGKSRDKGGDDSKTQIWILDSTGGEAWALTDSTRNVQQLDWAGNEALVFAAREDAGRRETAIKDDRKDTTQVVEDERHEPPVRLFQVTVKTKKVRRLSKNRDRIESLAVSPNGKYAVTGHARSLQYIYDNKIKPIFFLHDLKGDTSRRVLADANLNVSHVVWSGDSKGFYATNERSRKPGLNQAGVTELLYHDVAAGKERPVNLDWPRGLASQDDNAAIAGIVPLNEGFLALLADGIRHRLARYDRAEDTFRRRWLDGEHVANVFGLEATPDGKVIAYCHSTASSLPQWYQTQLSEATLSRARPMATMNKPLKSRRMARREVVRWKGAKGDEVEGLLFYPHHWKPGQHAPLVVQIHGGPAAADHDSWDESWAYSANLVCQRGAFVLRPNYHGSTGYGLDWVESIADGRYCDLEVEDIEKGIDALIARGVVDEKRLALTGWSNGAILTNVLITRSTRYCAAVAGAGSVEYVSDWSSCEFGEAFDRYYLGKSPLEDLNLYLRKSPFYRLDKVRTPTLILFGTEDRVVHPQQGWAMYRGMQQLGKAPVRFVQFPGEKHGLKKPAHRQRKLEEEMAWLDRHLFGISPKEKPGAVKPDSPLAWRIAREKARRFGKVYGVRQNEILVPETVEYNRLRLGRFEVTRAQYAHFDRSRRIPRGSENYPASGISFAQSKAYCAWLSKQTGQRYRLPTEAEADELYEKPEEGDNTLDTWAGFMVNPDDAVRLRKEVGKLSGTTPLLREVGSGRGKGKEMVFDLGGNVAEWAIVPDGKGISYGGSADAPADTRGKSLQAQRSYQGFRVVRD